MAELIAFLIQHFQDAEACPPQPVLGDLLETAGFDAAEINNALMLLEILTEPPLFEPAAAGSKAIRVYCADELSALPHDVLNLLYFLERAGALDSVQRELVVHALMHLPFDEVTEDMAKVVVLLALWVQNAEPPTLIGYDLMSVLQENPVKH
ncbi:MAG: DUF494 domain-containing protein [Neisseria sp.]|nr:DUF494 domain-containing protein [Neisseria sp.]